jgi:alpha-methylacyl-CoA racemase
VTGPLDGVRVVEVSNIGPVQFAGMLLADMGAEVLRVDRADHVPLRTNVAGFVSPYSVLDRGRRSVGLDLKHPRGAEAVLRLCETADVLVEGMRPGVAERLGIGPDAARTRNPRLVYARMTGWGQDGPLAGDVGHDLNYLALAGVLAHIGPAGGPPVIPLNLLADFGGGGMVVVLGVVAALLERERSGEGQVVDAAMVDGSAQLMSIFVGLDALGTWGARGTNLLDGGAHFYNVYETADAEWISIASYEPKFYANLLQVLGLDDLDPADQMDRERWTALKTRFAEIFRSKTRDEWVEVFRDHEVCFAPVLTMSEARAHAHNVARGTFVEVGGAPQPGPAPRFSRTPSAAGREPVAAGADTRAALADWGFTHDEIADLEASGAVAQA